MHCSRSTNLVDLFLMILIKDGKVFDILNANFIYFCEN